MTPQEKAIELLNKIGDLPADNHIKLSAMLVCDEVINYAEPVSSISGKFHRQWWKQVRRELEKLSG